MEKKTAGCLLTDADDLFDLDAGGVDFFREFTDGLVGVLVGEGVHIDPDPCGETERRGERHDYMFEVDRRECDVYTTSGFHYSLWLASVCSSPH